MTTQVVLLRAALATLIGGVCLLVATPVLGQCAMCSISAEAAADPDTVNRTFSAAVLVLLVPLVAVLAIVALLTWKARHWDGAVFETDENAQERLR